MKAIEAKAKTIETHKATTAVELKKIHADIDAHIKKSDAMVMKLDYKISNPAWISLTVDGFKLKTNHNITKPITTIDWMGAK